MASLANDTVAFVYNIEHNIQLDFFLFSVGPAPCAIWTKENTFAVFIFKQFIAWQISKIVLWMLLSGCDRKYFFQFAHIAT